MTNQVNIQADPSFQHFEPTVQSACHTILKLLNIDDTSLTVVLTNENAIHQLNLEYAGEDHTTDVLSFPSGDTDPDTGLQYLGDIVIAVPIAQKQSDAGGYSLKNELGLLAVHGTLHLLGYDHDDVDSAQQMWELQQEALLQMGFESFLADELS
jgi:probable rRNA maturation factor